MLSPNFASAIFTVSEFGVIGDPKAHYREIIAAWGHVVVYQCVEIQVLAGQSHGNGLACTPCAVCYQRQGWS